MKYKTEYKEIEPVSIRSENEILALAKLLSAPHPLAYKELWQVYEYKGEKMRGKMTYQQIKRLKNSMIEKGLIKETGKRKEEPDLLYDRKDYIPGLINRKTLDVNYDWLFSLLEEIGKFDPNMKYEGEDIWNYIERLYRSNLIRRKVLDPSHNLFQQEDVGTVSFKDLIYKYDVSNGDVRALYSMILCNLPMLIVLVRAMEEDIEIKLRDYPALREKILDYLEQSDNGFTKNFLDGMEVKWVLEKGSEEEKGIDPLDVESMQNKLYESDDAPASDNDLKELDSLLEPILVSWISAHFDQVSEDLDKIDFDNVETLRIKPVTLFTRQLIDMMKNKTDVHEKVIESTSH